MRAWCRFVAAGLLAAAMTLAHGIQPGFAQPRAHVYLFRGLADVYSLGMNTLADELNARGVDATAHSHTDWKSIADRVAVDYKAGKVGPIILVGHSLGADAVMEMADYLGDKGVPVALLVPFDGTQSFPVPGNVSHVINFTQRDYAYMRPGYGFRGTLSNVDLSADHSIDHVTIDKSPRLHAEVIGEVLALVSGRRLPTIDTNGVAAHKGAEGGANTEAAPVALPRPKPGDTAPKPAETMNPASSPVVPAVAAPERRDQTPASAVPESPPPAKPVVTPKPVTPLQIPD